MKLNLKAAAAMSLVLGSAGLVVANSAQADLINKNCPNIPSGPGYCQSGSEHPWNEIRTSSDNGGLPQICSQGVTSGGTVKATKDGVSCAFGTSFRRTCLVATSPHSYAISSHYSGSNKTLDARWASPADATTCTI